MSQDYTLNHVLLVWAKLLIRIIYYVYDTTILYMNNRNDR